MALFPVLKSLFFEGDSCFGFSFIAIFSTKHFLSLSFLENHNALESLLYIFFEKRGQMCIYIG